MKFTKLDTKRCVEYNSRYKIYFENEQCLTEFYRLQEFRCQVCQDDVSNLKELETHLKKEHDLYLCELCVNHLKIFPSERKYYNRKELIRHKKTGDPDNKSYKGHSSCYLCNTMFFDEDDLLSHLRKDHYNCHFCDSARTKMFFDNYQNLKKHFLDEHFICQEGFCKDEEITSAFANKFDLAAHKAQVHGTGKVNRNMIVDLDIDFRGANHNANYENDDYSRERDLHDRVGSSNNESTYQQSQSIPTQEDFPQLATSSGALGSSSNYATMTKNVTSLKKSNFSSKFQSPASIVEDFPALASSSSSVPSFAQKKLTVRPKQSMNKLTSKSNTTTNIQQQASLKYADIASSFPPLAQHIGINESWNKPLPTFTQDDFPDMPIKVKKTKKKTQYINVQKEAEKIAKKQKEEAEKKAELDKQNSLDNSNSQKTENTNLSTLNPLTNDGKMLSLKIPPGLHKLTAQTSNKNPPPGFGTNKNNENAFNMNSLNNMANELINSEKKNNNKNSKTTNDANNKNLSSSSRTGYIYPSNFNERNENLLKLIKQELRTDHKFEQFKTFTDKFIRGNIDGDFYFRKCLDLFDKNFLTSIFSELLVLMPHIKKQTDILAAYERYFNYNKGAMQKQSKSDGSKGVWILTNEKIEFLVCPNCGQVLKRDGKDGSEHMSNHSDNAKETETDLAS